MHALNILAEAKMRQWEQDRRAGRVSLQSGNQTSFSSGHSLEKLLFDDICALYAQARTATGAERLRLSRDAEKLQIQLTVRLERQGYATLAKWYGDMLLQRRQGVDGT